jgi:hypothetical protein
MKKIWIIIVLAMAGTISINAQCNDQLSEKLKAQMTDKEEYLNSFKAALKESDKDVPVSVAKFSITMEKGTKYRLRILSDDQNYKGKGILRLFEGDQFLGSTFKPETKIKHFPFFDFDCQKTGDYGILITFQDGRAGCAVVMITKIKKGK